MTNKKIIRTVGKDMETLNSYIWLVENSMAVPAKIKQLLAYEPELLLLGRGGEAAEVGPSPRPLPSKRETQMEFLASA